MLATLAAAPPPSLLCRARGGARRILCKCKPREDICALGATSACLFPAHPPHPPPGAVDMANPAPLGFMAFSLATCL